VTMLSLVLVGSLAIAAGTPLQAQTDQLGTVFALLDKNEWCAGGSVYLDLKSGAFLSYPRLARPACTDSKNQHSVKRGRLHGSELEALRTAYLAARLAGLKRENCDPAVSNGGPEALALTGPAFSARTPENEGCWSSEAVALHRQLFKVFGGQEAPDAEAR